MQALRDTTTIPTNTADDNHTIDLPQQRKRIRHRRQRRGIDHDQIVLRLRLLKQRLHRVRRSPIGSINSPGFGGNDEPATSTSRLRPPEPSTR
jgi:hypothetical protein